MTPEEERKVIKSVSGKTKDSLFKMLSMYKFLNITDILLIRYAILNEIITKEDAKEMLDKSDSVDKIKEYIQSTYAITKTNI